jgi:UDP-N-acetylglucosamine 2-epimerase (non-hydrolysing)
VPALAEGTADPMKIAVTFGTRPEAIKLAPVIRELRKSAAWTTEVVLTAQHRALLDQVLEVFAISADCDLDVMQPRQTLPELSSRVLVSLDRWLTASRPDLLIVQGDTTSAFIAALAAFYRGVPVAHVEAGLRTPSGLNPFPEEMNRRLVSRLAMLHFAPTAAAQSALIAEGVPPETIHVTGNTVVDALQTILASPAYARASLPIEVGPGDRVVLVTMHRRESWERIEGVCAAIAEVARARPDVRVVFPVHPNPAVREPVYRWLGSVPHVSLVDPLDYLAFVKMMAASHVILTDSGGVQEEAPVLARPLLVLRDTTERGESIDAGVARLVGTTPSEIVKELSTLLDDHEAWARMSRAVSPFGDGRAAQRIVTIIDEQRRVICSYGRRDGNPRQREAS